MPASGRQLTASEGWGEQGCSGMSRRPWHLSSSRCRTFRLRETLLQSRRIRLLYRVEIEHFCASVAPLTRRWRNIQSRAEIQALSRSDSRPLRTGPLASSQRSVRRPPVTRAGVGIRGPDSVGCDRGRYIRETYPQILFKKCSHYCELVSSTNQMPRTHEVAVREAVGKRESATPLFARICACRSNPPLLSNSSNLAVDNLQISPCPDSRIN